MAEGFPQIILVHDTQTNSEVEEEHAGVEQYCQNIIPHFSPSRLTIHDCITNLLQTILQVTG